MTADTYQETPVYESSNRAMQPASWGMGHALVGLGAFVLLVKLLPGAVLFPLALMVAGGYLLRQDKVPANLAKPGVPFTRGHALVGLGGFFLLNALLPFNVVLALLLIGAGMCHLRRKG